VREKEIERPVKEKERSIKEKEMSENKG